MNRRTAWLTILAALAVASCDSVSVRLPTDSNVSIHTGLASAAEGAISIEADGWTYGVPLDGVTWIDATGSTHEDGRPDCLAADQPARQVRFAAVEVTIEGRTWRPVVWVDCR